MILAIQDQRLRDLGRGVLCVCWGGVEELGKFRHGGGGGGKGSLVLVGGRWLKQMALQRHAIEVVCNPWLLGVHCVGGWRWR